MNRILFALLSLMLPLVATAQEEAYVASAPLHFGYFSHDSVLHAMPEYALAERSFKDLKLKYVEELKRSEDEFNKKYEDFLDGQRDFVPSILRKRQAELQDLMEKSLAFRQETERLLQQAEHELFAPLHEKINNAVQIVGKEQGFAFILNTDGGTLPYVNNAIGEDVTQHILKALEH